MTWLDDSIFQSIAAELEALEVEKPKTPSWSSGLIEKLNPKVEYLWISELLHSPPQAFQWLNLDDPDQLHDYELLGLNIDSFGDQDTVKNAFLTSRLYRWFKSQLRSEKDEQYTNFGWLSATLISCDPGVTLRYGKKNGRLLIPTRVFVEYLNKGKNKKYFDDRRLIAFGAACDHAPATSSPKGMRAASVQANVVFEN